MHFTVRFNVVLGGFLGVFGGMDIVAVGQVSVMGSRFVVAFQMMLGGFMVMARSVLVVLRCSGVMVCCFF
ncbi:MAG: hypothetical protein ACLPH3_04170 [Terracidiphilus sp.]